MQAAQLLRLETTGSLDTSMPGALSLEELQDRYDDGESARAAEIAAGRPAAAAPGGCAVGRPDGGATAVQEPQPHVSGATAAATDATLLDDPEDSEVEDGHDDDTDLELQDYLELHDGAAFASAHLQAAAPRCSLLPREIHRRRWWVMRGAAREMGRGMVVRGGCSLAWPQMSGMGASAPIAVSGKWGGGPISSCDGAPRNRHQRRCNQPATARRCTFTQRARATRASGFETCRDAGCLREWGPLASARIAQHVQRRSPSVASRRIL